MSFLYSNAPYFTAVAHNFFEVWHNEKFNMTHSKLRYENIQTIFLRRLLDKYIRHSFTFAFVLFTLTALAAAIRMLKANAQKSVYGMRNTKFIVEIGQIWGQKTYLAPLPFPYSKCQLLSLLKVNFLCLHPTLLDLNFFHPRRRYPFFGGFLKLRPYFPEIFIS